MESIAVVSARDSHPPVSSGHRGASGSPRAASSTVGHATTSSLTWGASACHGRGIFATCSLAPGAVVERAPAIEVTDATSVRPYLFIRDRRAADASPGLVLVLGLMSLCNHSAQPNAEVSLAFDGTGELVAMLRVISAIEPGEEVVIEYPDFSYYREQGLA